MPRIPRSPLRMQAGPVRERRLVDPAGVMRAIHQSDAGGSTRLVLLVLLMLSGKTGAVEVSLQELADLTQMGDAHLRHSIRWLRQAGEIEVTRPARGRGRYNRYEVLIGRERNGGAA